MDVTQNASDKKILIVEDDKMLRTILLEKLTHHGFNAIGAIDGEEGLRVALESKPDLILLDIFLPKMDGITVLKKLRASFGKELPIFILTNLEPDDKMIKNIAEFQPSYYLLKFNIELEDLINKINETLKLDV